MSAATEPSFDGEIFFRGDDGFENARLSRVFNHRVPDRQPAAVLLASSEQDIVAGVRLAAEKGWQVSVRSGGHSWAVWSVRDDALLIDVGGFQEMDFDPETGIATATPSVKGGEVLAPFLAERGRFFGGGHCPPVGIGGFLLQGGMGWCCRGWGWAAESVVAVDVVTADGELVRADANTNTDLYWAARGTGPCFPGVVTRFHLQTIPHPGHVAETVHLYHLDDFDEVMTWLHETHHAISPDVEIVAVTMTPPVPIPGHEGFVLAVTAVALVDDEAAAREALAPFGECPAINRVLARTDAAPVNFETLRERQVLANPEGHRYRVDNAWISGSATEVVPAIRRSFVDLPTPQSFTIWFSMAPLRDLPDMALSLQSEIYLATYTLSQDAKDDDLLHRWVDEVMAEMEPVTIGQYLGDSDLANRQVKVLSDVAFARLERIRAERDPDGRFVGYLADPNVPLNTNHWET